MKIPQMSPMNWLILFFIFNFVLFISFCKIYFLSKIIYSSDKIFYKSINSYIFII